MRLIHLTTNPSGNFGVVQKVKRVATGEYFAMKVIDKMKITNYQTKGPDDTLMEVKILQLLRHPSIPSFPFRLNTVTNADIISVVEVCDTPRYVYLILELCVAIFIGKRCTYFIFSANQGELFEKIYNKVI